MIFLDLFLSFLKVGVFSIGGGYAAMPIIQSQAVDKFAWLTAGEFTDLISIAEMTPGPITINAATFIGIRTAGVPGALVATAGCVIPSLIIVTAMFFIYKKFGQMKASQTVLSFIRPAVVALIASAGITLLKSAVLGGGTVTVTPLEINLISSVIFLIAFVIIRKFKTNPIIIMASGGVVYLLINVIIR